MQFDEAFTKLMGLEGEYSNNPADPGGATRWGVTEKVARQHGYTGDMRDYPIGEAKELYRTEYWNAVRAEELPDSIRFSVFDAAVNSGVQIAIRWLQSAVVVTADGVLGSVTMNAVSTMPVGRLLSRYEGLRLRFMTNSAAWNMFGRGWARRIADNLLT